MFLYAALIAGAAELISAEFFVAYTYVTYASYMYGT